MKIMNYPLACTFQHIQPHSTKTTDPGAARENRAHTSLTLCLAAGHRWRAALLSLPPPLPSSWPRSRAPPVYGRSFPSPTTDDRSRWFRCSALVSSGKWKKSASTAQYNKKQKRHKDNEKKKKKKKHTPTRKSHSQTVR